MRVFISSLNRGFEAFRDAAASGVETLGHQPIRAETFGAAPGSPQQACLAGVREADVLLLLLGAQYGHPQASGLSATHDEYREARDTKPVIVLIQQDVELEASQAKFIEEVQGWEHGHFSAGFHDADDLQGRVIRALHDYVLANETGPSDESELTDRATALIPGTRSGGSTDLVVAIAGAPLRAVLRPAELESEELRRFPVGRSSDWPGRRSHPGPWHRCFDSWCGYPAQPEPRDGIRGPRRRLAVFWWFSPRLIQAGGTQGSPPSSKEVITERIAPRHPLLRPRPRPRRSGRTGEPRSSRRRASRLPDICHGEPEPNTSAAPMPPRWALRVSEQRARDALSGDAATCGSCP